MRIPNIYILNLNSYESLVLITCMKQLCNFYTIRCANNLFTLMFYSTFESEIAWTFDKYAKIFWILLHFQSLVALVYFHGQKKERGHIEGELCVNACVRVCERESESERGESTTRYSCVVCLRRPITTKNVNYTFFRSPTQSSHYQLQRSNNLCSKKTRFRISWFKYFSFECLACLTQIVSKDIIFCTKVLKLLFEKVHLLFYNSIWMGFCSVKWHQVKEIQ